MYTLQITDDNEIISKREVIMEKSNAVDQIRILVNKSYKGQLDITDASVYMRYVLPISKKIKTKVPLVRAEEDYNENMMQFYLPANVNDLTAESGDVEVSFTFVKIIQNDDDTITSAVRKTQSGIIHITPLSSFDDFDISENYTDFDQRIIAMEVLQKQMIATTDAIYNGMAQDIRLNKNDRKITLADRDGNDMGEGVEMNDISSMVAEDLVGKDPDGVQDGVVNLDQISGVQMMNLDELLK